MSRAVYIGGFGNGRASAEGVRDALGAFYEDVDEFTFSGAITSYDEVRKATKSVPAYTHSAGMMALEGARPEVIHAFDAPLPTGRLRLLGRTLIKTARLNTPGVGIHSVPDVQAVMKYNASSVAELAAHPIANLRPFLNGQISRFDGIQAAISAHKSNIPTTLVYMDKDIYFKLSEDLQRQAEFEGVMVVRMAGEHDELVLHPGTTLGNYAAEVNH